MNDILFLLGLDWETLAIAILAAPTGAIMLSQYARPLGRLSFVVNALALFLGAAVTSGAVHKLGWPLAGHLERQLLACFGGMAVVALVIIFKWPRSRLGL